MNENNELISIIIPCYQQGRFLRDCVESLQAQSYPFWEAIIVDDGSIDSPLFYIEDIISKDLRVKYFRKDNGGLSSARNFGLVSSRGSFVQFLDADDLLEPDKIKHQINVFKSSKELDIVYGSALYFDDGNIEKTRFNIDINDRPCDWISNHWLGKGSLSEKILNDNLFPVCAPLIKASVIKRVGYFNEQLKALEDWEFWFRCLKEGAVLRYSPARNTGALIRVHPGSLSKNSDVMQEGYFDINLFFAYSIKDCASRNAILSRLRSLNRTLSSSRRKYRYAKIFNSPLNLWDKFIFGILFLFDKGGVFGEVATAISNKIPELRKAFAKFLLFKF